MATTVDEVFKKIRARQSEIMRLLSRYYTIELSKEIRTRVMRRVRQKTPRVSSQLRNSWSVKRRSSFQGGRLKVEIDVQNTAPHGKYFKPKGGMEFASRNQEYATSPQEIFRRAWSELGSEVQRRAFFRAVQRVINRG